MVDPTDANGVKIEESDEKKSPKGCQKKKNTGKYTQQYTRSDDQSYSGEQKSLVRGHGKATAINLYYIPEWSRTNLSYSPELDKKSTNTQKEMWRIHANNTMKIKESLEANSESMYTLVLSICDPVLKYQVCDRDYEDMNNKQDTLSLMRCIKNDYALQWR